MFGGRFLLPVSLLTVWDPLSQAGESFFYWTFKALSLLRLGVSATGFLRVKNQRRRSSDHLCLWAKVSFHGTSPETSQEMRWRWVSKYAGHRGCVLQQRPQSLIMLYLFSFKTQCLQRESQRQALVVGPHMLCWSLPRTAPVPSTTGSTAPLISKRDPHCSFPLISD